MAGCSAPTVDKTGLVGSPDGVLLQDNKQEVWQAAPLYGIGNFDPIAWKNFRMYDVYSGHAINSMPDNKSQYYLEKDGKAYTQGNCFYTGYYVAVDNMNHA